MLLALLHVVRLLLDHGLALSSHCSSCGREGQDYRLYCVRRGLITIMKRVKCVQRQGGRCYDAKRGRTLVNQHLAFSLFLLVHVDSNAWLIHRLAGYWVNLDRSLRILLLCRSRRSYPRHSWLPHDGPLDLMFPELARLWACSNRGTHSVHASGC